MSMILGKNEELELRLDEVLVELDWTQTQLAKKLGMNKQYVNELVHNKVPQVSMKTIGRLAAATGYSVESLLRKKKTRK